MRRVVYSGIFQKEWKRLNTSGLKNIDSIRESFDYAQKCLRKGEKLPDRYHDHPLKNDKEERRDCHIVGDLVLLYKLTETKLILYRINTHSEIYG